MDDWRLEFGDFLLPMNIRMAKKVITYDHEHCCFCWDKMSNEGDALRYGYCDLNEKYWVCETCYNDFKDISNWIREE